MPTFLLNQPTIELKMKRFESLESFINGSSSKSSIISNYPKKIEKGVFTSFFEKDENSNLDLLVQDKAAVDKFSMNFIKTKEYIEDIQESQEDTDIMS